MMSKRLLSEGQTIVVVDDDNQSLKIFQEALKNLSSCNIKYFNNVNDTFEKFVKDNHIDLFVMDVVLGDNKNALEVSENLICNKRGSLFLFISGYDYTKESFLRLEGKCVYDFLAKPFDISDFLNIIVTLLNISSTYKHAFVNTRIVPRESQVDEMRKTYMRLIKEDKLLIEKLKSCC